MLAVDGRSRGGCCFLIGFISRGSGSGSSCMACCAAVLADEALTVCYMYVWCAMLADAESQKRIVCRQPSPVARIRPVRGWSYHTIPHHTIPYHTIPYGSLGRKLSSICVTTHMAWCGMVVLQPKLT